MRDVEDDVEPLERSEETVEGVVPPDDEATDDDADRVRVEIGSS